MSPRCPEMGLACSTAYDRGCRCEACVDHSQERSRIARQRKKLKDAAAANAMDMPLNVDLRELVRLADAAFRKDPSYAADIIEAYQNS